MSAQIGEPLDLSGPTIVPISVVRQWAADRGLPVGSRGHLPQTVIDQFNRRHRRKQAVSKNPFLKSEANDAADR